MGPEVVLGEWMGFYFFHQNSKSRAWKIIINTDDWNNDFINDSIFFGSKLMIPFKRINSVG